MSRPRHVGVGIGRCMAARGEEAVMLKGCPTETSTQINSTRQRRCYLSMKTYDTGKSKGLEWKSCLKLDVVA